MATNFSEVRDYIRAAVLDLDTNIQIYSDNALDSQLRFEMLLRNASPYGTDDPCFYVQETPPVGSTDTFLTDLTAQQKAILALRCAVRIISGKPDDFSYKTPALSVARKGQSRALQFDLEAALASVLGGRFAIASDTDFGALIQSYNRFVNALNGGIFAWPGTPDGMLQSEV